MASGARLRPECWRFPGPATPLYLTFSHLPIIIGVVEAIELGLRLPWTDGPAYVAAVRLYASALATRCVRGVELGLLAHVSVIWFTTETGEHDDVVEIGLSESPGCPAAQVLELVEGAVVRWQHPGVRDARTVPVVLTRPGEALRAQVERIDAEPEPVPLTLVELRAQLGEAADVDP